MNSRLFDLYQRKRVINININIIVAGLLAILIARYPVLVVADWIGREHKFINAVVAAVIDAAADGVIYFVLHWVANHWKPRAAARPGPSRHFWRDATLVQVERLILTPPFYAVAVGGMFGLQHAGLSPSWAFVVAFSAAIVLTRTIHTVWGMRTGRFRDFAPEPGPGGGAEDIVAASGKIPPDAA